MTRCKKEVRETHAWGLRPCERNAVLDGYCKQHHPDTIRKRNLEGLARYRQQQYQQALHSHLPGYARRMHELLERIVFQKDPLVEDVRALLAEIERTRPKPPESEE